MGCGRLRGRTPTVWPAARREVAQATQRASRGLVAGITPAHFLLGEVGEQHLAESGEGGAVSVVEGRQRLNCGLASSSPDATGRVRTAACELQPDRTRIVT